MGFDRSVRMTDLPELIVVERFWVWQKRERQRERERGRRRR